MLGSVRTTLNWKRRPGKDGVTDVLDDLFSYGTKNLDRLAFQKALDDIAADESAGFDFSLQVLKAGFLARRSIAGGQRVESRASRARHSMSIKPQTAQFVAGRMKSPGYRAGRALNMALLPAGDPVLRETTPQTVSSLTSTT